MQIFLSIVCVCLVVLTIILAKRSSLLYKGNDSLKNKLSLALKEVKSLEDTSARRLTRVWYPLGGSFEGYAVCLMVHQDGRHSAPDNLKDRAIRRVEDE
jgi:hypothetical protein